MSSRGWSFVAGLFLTGASVFIGLILNFIISGNPLAVVETTNSVVDGTTILLTTLFIAISGGHYIGGSFDNESDGRWLALGANTVLWIVVVGFIAYRYLEGGPILEPVLFGAALFFIGGGVFALHKSRNIEDGSQFDAWIDSLSSRGTGLIVTAAFIARTIPDPVLGGVVGVGLLVLGAVLWHYTADELREWRDSLLDVAAEFSSAEDVDETEEKPGD